MANNKQAKQTTQAKPQSKGAKKKSPTPVVKKTTTTPRMRDLKAAPPTGVEVDPHESTDLTAVLEKDTTVYTLDKTRCITTHEVTLAERTLQGEDAVIRQFFTRPTVTGAESAARADARGVYLGTKSHTVRVENVSQATITFMATTANSVDDTLNSIGTRTMLADNVTIRPGQAKTFRVDRGGMYPYKFQDDAGRVNEHIFDGYVIVPDTPPQDQSDIQNETITTADDKTINRQTRVWSEKAEIARFSVRTEYLVQKPPNEYQIERVPSHPVKFATDFKIPFGHTTATYIMAGGKLSSGNTKSVTSSAYDIARDGWLGMGIAFMDDPATDTTVAYLAKFKAPTAARKAKSGLPPRENWAELSDGERDEIRASALSDYPAYRKVELEDDKLSITLPGGVGFNYDANGDDLNVIVNNFRWSHIHSAFVLWDYCRNKPYYIESGWAYPNYYQEWTACLPPVGYLEVMNPSGAALMIYNEEVDSKYLMEKAVNWDIVVLAITFIIEMLKGINNIASEMRRTAPQG